MLTLHLKYQVAFDSIFRCILYYVTTSSSIFSINGGAASSLNNAQCNGLCHPTPGWLGYSTTIFSCYNDNA